MSTFKTAAEIPPIQRDYVVISPTPLGQGEWLCRFVQHDKENGCGPISLKWQKSGQRSTEVKSADDAERSQVRRTTMSLFWTICAIVGLVVIILWFLSLA